MPKEEVKTTMRDLIERARYDQRAFYTLFVLWLIAVLIALAMIVVAFSGGPKGGEAEAPQGVSGPTSAPAAPLLGGVTLATAEPAPGDVAVQPSPPAPGEAQAESGGGAPPLLTAEPTSGDLRVGPPPFGYGIQVHGLIGDPRHTVGVVKDKLGLTWIKQQVRWHDFSPAQGQMDWSGYDAIINAANEKGLRVMLSVVAAPEWAISYRDANPEGAPPDNYQDLADFLTALVQRYKGKIHAIEIWNEQNLDREWDTAEGVNAARYVEMLKVASQAIRAQDPNIIIISGALSPTGANLTDPNNPNRVIVQDDFAYFQAMLQAGFLDWVDCVGAHHNGINLPPDVEWQDAPAHPKAATAIFRGPFDNPHRSWSFKSTIWGYRDLMQQFGQTKPICVTEFGWASAEGWDTVPPGFEFAWDNSLQEQALYISRAYQMLQESDFVWLAFLWNLDFAQKDGIGPTDPNAPYSILDFDGVPRPAFDVLSQMPKP